MYTLSREVGATQCFQHCAPLRHGRAPAPEVIEATIEDDLAPKLEALA